eukprot:1148007-Pelagomonas_calceolata.AAC.2
MVLGLPLLLLLLLRLLPSDLGANSVASSRGIGPCSTAVFTLLLLVPLVLADGAACCKAGVGCIGAASAGAAARAARSLVCAALEEGKSRVDVDLQGLGVAQAQAHVGVGSPGGVRGPTSAAAVAAERGLARRAEEVCDMGAWMLVRGAGTAEEEEDDVEEVVQGLGGDGLA